MKSIFESLWYERSYPFIFAVLIAVSLHFSTDLRFPTDDSIFTALYSASISLAAVLVGFMATMYAVLMTLPSMIRRLSKLDYVDVVISYFTQGMIFGLVFASMNLFAFFSDQFAKTHEFFTIWILSASIAILTFYRISHLISKIFILLSKQP
ncbi:MAG: hypothetical protein JHC38_09890 [Thiotrichales bacterium]|jgi:hypothetical protein|nr:hypothetical protein [Thiotrichales bacterium]